MYSEPWKKEKYLKTRVKSYEGRINTNFHDNGIPKNRSHSFSLLVILIESTFNLGRNYYAQVRNELSNTLSKEKVIQNSVVWRILN